MEAGPLFDALIARLLWRSVVVYNSATNSHHLVSASRTLIDLPEFSSEVDESQRVVQCMTKDGYTLRIRRMFKQGHVLACFLKDDGRKYSFSRSETLAHAICLAAVAAKDGSHVKSSKIAQHRNAA